MRVCKLCKFAGYRKQESIVNFIAIDYNMSTEEVSFDNFEVLRKPIPELANDASIRVRLLWIFCIEFLFRVEMMERMLYDSYWVLKLPSNRRDLGCIINMSSKYIFLWIQYLI